MTFPVRALALALTALAFLPVPAAQALQLRASFYGAESGRRTASGAPFRPDGRTAAHPFWSFGTRFRACYRGCAEGIVTDRGPAAWTGRGIDLSRGLALAIGLTRVGVATVDIELLGGAPAGRSSHRHSRRSRNR